jgi:serine/threonine protein kinase
MPALPKEGQVIISEDRHRVSYTIAKELNVGNFSNAYEARDNSGKKIFLKAYKSPTSAVGWYKGFIAHNSELAKCATRSEAAHYCVLPQHCFEGKVGKCPFAIYFQTFEFIEGGQDLGSLLRKAEEDPASLVWQRRLDMAKVTLMCLSTLHEAKIVHGDLKPPNIQLIHDPSIGIKDIPRLIDMDYAFFAHKTAPWHGHIGYVGTLNYQSPEHVLGKIPTPASDVFTTALILYELLGQDHPYRSEDIGTYSQKVTNGYPPKIQWRHELDNMSKADELADLLIRALSPIPEKRPDIESIRTTLLQLQPGPGTKDAYIIKRTLPSPPTHTPPPTHTLPPSPPPRPKFTTIKLTGDRGELTRKIGATLGGGALGEIHSEGKFASPEQFYLRRAENKWFISPNKNAKNITTVNGNPLSEEIPLNNGDIIALKGKTKTAMQLTVTLEST